MPDKYFFRQSFIASSLFIYSFSGGMTMAFPSVLILSILSTTADIKGTQDDASWLGACNASTGLIGFFVLSPIMQKFGRKSTNILVNIIVAAGWITFSFATSITTLFIGRLIHGICFGAVHINAIMISEYTDAKRRGYFGAIKKFSVSLGVLCCHSLALCWTWKQISIFAILPALIVIILTWFWPESPSFLALKGRFEDCKESFYWINGNSVEKDNELTVLIASQSQRIEKKKRKQANVLNVLFQALSQRNFLNSLFTATVLTLSSDASGKFYFFSYVIQIMKELVNDKHTAIYCSIIAESVIAVGLFSSCFFIHRFKRRTVVLSTGTTSALLMLLISILLFLKSKYDLGIHLTWSILFILFVQNFISNLGLIPVSYIIIGEIFSLEHRGLGSCASGVSFMIFYFIALKLAPVAILRIGLHNMYLICGLCTLFCILILYYILPETKDKTLQTIEDEIGQVKRTPIETSVMLD